MKDEELKKIVEEVIGNNDPFWNLPVYNIVKKIIDLPIETITTIADLINYNPEETFVEPLTQGEILNLVEDTCKKLNIKIEDVNDSIGGLAYYYKFKKNDKRVLIVAKNDQQKRVFSQEELKDFFYHCMTEKELDKIRELDLNSMIEEIQSPTYQIKYIENVGYILIGEGYLILDNGTEPTHYFAKIFTSDEEIKNEIINIYNEKFSNV